MFQKPSRWWAAALCAFVLTACVDDQVGPNARNRYLPPPSLSVVATNAHYTLDGQFDDGTLLNVNHDSPNNDQLQLNRITQPFPFVNVAKSGMGTAVRIDVNTGVILGEFFTSPNGMGRDPSRTTVDQRGNVWVSNRAEAGLSGGFAKGSVTRIGLIIGGTRVNADGSPNPAGEYLAPPFGYSTCVDRDNDNLIRTSRGLGDVRPWTNTAGADSHGGVSTAQDECIINYVRVRATNTRTVAIDANNDLWTGGTNTTHEKVDGVTGNVIPGTVFNLFCGGYGGLIDRNNVLWSARFGNNLLRYDLNTASGTCLNTNHGDYGLGVDPNTGEIWHSTLSNGRIMKLSSSGSVLGTFAHGNSFAQGVAVDGSGNVWVAHSLLGPQNTVGHLRTDGTFVGNVLVGSGPTGVAVDANGKVWVTNYNSWTAQRINPNAGPIGGGGFPVGAVDLTVNLGPNAFPYNYSDMTGFVAIGSTSPQGSWTVVQDGGAAGTQWGKVTWNTESQGFVPPGGSITAEARTAETEAGLSSATFVPVGNGTNFTMTGRYIEVRVTLRAAPDGTSPVLSDVRIETAVIEVKGQMKPGSDPPSFSSKSKGSIPLAIYSTQRANGEAVDFDATTIDWSTVKVGPNGAPEIHGQIHIQDAAELGEPAGDTDLDAVLHVDFQAAGISCGQTTVTITGKTTSGDSFVATAAIRLTGC